MHSGLRWVDTASLFSWENGSWQPSSCSWGQDFALFKAGRRMFSSFILDITNLIQKRASVEDLLYSKALWSRLFVDPWFLQQLATANHLFSWQVCALRSVPPTQWMWWERASMEAKSKDLSSLLKESGATTLRSWCCYWAKAISAMCSRTDRTLGGWRISLLIWIWCWITATRVDLWVFSSILSVNEMSVWDDPLKRLCGLSLLKEDEFYLSEKPQFVLKKKKSLCFLLHFEHQLKLHIFI